MNASLSKLSLLRTQIAEQTHTDEHQLVESFIDKPSLSQSQRQAAMHQAKSWVSASREDKKGQSLIDSFLLEFGLSNEEGVALMCLAESLLRIPDNYNIDRLIAEKISSGNWGGHLGRSESLFVNASSIGLLLTGKIVQLDEEIYQQPKNWLNNLLVRMSEPVLRSAFSQAMKLMGQHYVLGRTIEEGLRTGNQNQRKRESQNLFSFDMLGEAARTEGDARRYYEAYSDAIEAIGKERSKFPDKSLHASNGISVKLSALHPRYEHAQRKLVMNELYPRIKSLCIKAANFDIGLSIDAEEAARLDLSLDIFEQLASATELVAWQGLGFVMQAYQKRAPLVAQWLIELAKNCDRRIMVRLVKGAYWDYEIKHAQEQGLSDYPVFTRKVHTDTCYLHCARLLLESKSNIYPQFATHNAYTAACVMELANNSSSNTDFEFQRLHGMGELLYKNILLDSKMPVRVYAPIGRHKDLLPYLVRRLLENGANSSFVNRFLDAQTSINELIKDHHLEVIATAEKNKSNSEANLQFRHEKIPLPEDIFIQQGERRKNSAGLDLDSKLVTRPLSNAIKEHRSTQRDAYCIVDGLECGQEKHPIFSPQNTSIPIANYFAAKDKDLDTAISEAYLAWPAWANTPADDRAASLEKMASLLELHRQELIALITLEAGRTIADAESEIREAVDFCRYYAEQATNLFHAAEDISSRGVFLCISPWNFPLAIFVGQIAAALAVGNTVIAKPAEQTALVAMRACEFFHEAGIPAAALHLLLGDGQRLATRLIQDQRLAGVCFTGSTAVAKKINCQLADRPGAPLAFIAETGGQNCMVADSTALPEQLVDDIISSAFKSAGQRCSALRVLFIQEDIADQCLTMLKGAMQCLKMGPPDELETDIGPVIDEHAKRKLESHSRQMQRICKQSFVLAEDEYMQQGSFFAPRFFEIDSSSYLQEEHFGPILHVIRYRSDALDDVIEQIRASGFGLTLGVHSRITGFAQDLIQRTNVGNNYINRNMVGAVVGVNPFGGMGLSGTGPKAGGPAYLSGFCGPRASLSTQAPRTRYLSLLQTY